MIRERDADVDAIESIHGGIGKATMHNFFNGKLSLKIFVHNIVLSRGGTIGLHEHADSEEIYYVISGEGTMKVDGEESGIGPGDAVLTKKGSSHGLKNIGKTDLRLIVVGEYDLQQDNG